ncbi:hypothetical protein SLS53_002290 [Cytospora paraplurivora]|uniref:Rhodopsin domain-containing protein n=1 Tax=Cytospora paraplurivora TaxID=2898453 RepID=A0AAN9YJD5_9PEZI
MGLPGTTEQIYALADVAHVGSAGGTRSNIQFVNPYTEVNTGIWLLFVGATAFLGLRLWCKLDRRTGLWWDDRILIVSWVVLLATNIFISVELATGYVVKTWDDRMLILVSISSCLVTVGQTLTKTAFAVTLLRITESWQRAVLWFIIASINMLLVVVLIFNWINYCGQSPYWWKMPNVCAAYDVVFGVKIAQNIYNIILDFVLSLFPWVITWNLNIDRLDKIGICVSMSLGVIIAIFTSVRTWYMLDADINTYDAWYFWRQGMTEVWYQAEVAGTIIVQALPVIRLFVQDLQVSLMPMRLNENPAGMTVLTIGTGTNKTARHSRAWAAANNPHSLSDVDDLESGKGSSEVQDRYRGGGAGDVERFELHDLGEAGVVEEGTKKQTEYVVQMGYAL